MPKRSRFVAIFLMPVAVLLWSIGWSLCWLGSKQETDMLREPSPKREQMDDLSFNVIAPEQQYAT